MLSMERVVLHLQDVQFREQGVVKEKKLVNRKVQTTRKRLYKERSASQNFSFVEKKQQLSASGFP